MNDDHFDSAELRDRGSQEDPSRAALVGRVYERLLREILAGQLLPGTPLREVELAARFGVSRTPLREAIARLAEYGVVEPRRNRSAVVRRLTWADPGYIHQMREALEGMATELACGRLTSADFARLQARAEAARNPDAPDYYALCDAYDIALHRLIAMRANNPLMAREIRRLQDLTLLIEHQLESTKISEQHFDDSDRKHMRQAVWKEHQRIVEALRAGSAAESRSAMVEHIRSSCDVLTRLMHNTRW